MMLLVITGDAKQNLTFFPQLYCLTAIVITKKKYSEESDASVTQSLTKGRHWIKKKSFAYAHYSEYNYTSLQMGFTCHILYIGF